MLISTELLVSALGALVAILVAVSSSILAHRNSIKFENRKLVQDQYIRYIVAVHNLAASDSEHMKKCAAEYASERDKMLLTGKCKVIQKLLVFENNCIGKYCDKYNEYLTELIKEMRKDLGIKSNNLPLLGLTK